MGFQRKTPPGLIRESILRGVSAFGDSIEELFWIFIDARKGILYTERQRWRRYERRLSGKQLSVARKDFSSFISKLKKANLIQKEDGKLKITRRGLRKVASLGFLRRKSDIITHSQTELPAGRYVLVIFDVPEIHKRKRAWLRSLLRELNYKLIQKSVWMGERKISKEFLEGLRGLEIAKYVEIFEVSKLGSLER